MKQLMIVAAILSLSFSMAAQSASGQGNTVHSSGAFAGMSSFSNGSNLFLNVSRSDTNGVKSTFLNFDAFTFTPEGFTDIFAFGQIPDGALKGDNTKHLSLNVDTSQLTPFQTVTCTFSFVNFTFTCQPGPFGVVQLEFQQDGSFVSRNISDTHFTFFQFDVHNQQNSDSASAFANGSVLGIQVSNGFSNIGTNRDTTITLTPVR